jgi:tetratricopeptide (TPR) repeat protein
MLGAMEDESLDRAYWDAAEEGAELLREGDLDGAVGELSALVQRSPENPYGYYFLAAALFEKRELGRALKAYLSAIERKPDYLGALIGAGWTLHGLGRFKEALRVGHQVLARVKEDPDALHLLGLSHYAVGDNAAALGYLRRFIATRPEIEVAMEVEGLVKVLEGDVLPLRDDSDADDDQA